MQLARNQIAGKGNAGVVEDGKAQCMLLNGLQMSDPSRSERLSILIAPLASIGVPHSGQTSEVSSVQ